MNYTLKNYQEKVVNKVGRRIEDSEIVETLKAYANSPFDTGLKNSANQNHGVQIKAPTGAGKTIIIGSIIREHLKDFVTLVFSPGAGNLEEQTAKKLKDITGSTQIINESTFCFSPVPGVNYVSNWEALVSMRKGSNAYITKLSKDSENSNIFDWLGELSASKTPVAIIIDESHHGSAKASGAILSFLDDIRRTLGYAPYLIEASATPILKEGAKEGIVEIEVSDVIKAGLLRKTVRLNSGAGEIIAKMTANERSDTDLEEVIFKAAYAKLQEIDKEYIRVGSAYHGLMAIQLPSSVAGKEAIDRIQSFFRPLGITVENGQMALFMNGAKEGDMEIIHTPESPVRVLLYKQGISMGWDCPRAQVLVGLRHLTSKVFTTQNLGRFIRTTEVKHYNNDILDSAYVYSNVGDMGSKNYEKDVDHTLPYEGEVSLHRVDGRFSLQSINDLELDLDTFSRRNQDALDRKTFYATWIKAVNDYRMWDHLKAVETSEVTDTLNEMETSVANVSNGEDSIGSAQVTKAVGKNHMIEWAKLNSQILDVIKKDGRDYGNNANVANIVLPAIIRWMTEALTFAPSDAPKREHWGQMAAIYEQSVPEKTRDIIDFNAYLTEYLTNETSFSHFAAVLDEVFSTEALSPAEEVSADGEQETKRNTREKVSLGAYVLPHTLKVMQTAEHEVNPDYVSNYAYTCEEVHGDGSSVTRAFRQEGKLSDPENSFEEYLNGLEIPVTYVKNGTKNRSNYSLPVSNDFKEINFYPDYLAEFTIACDTGYLPAILEVKDANIADNMDKMVFEKAAALIALSTRKNIPAGVVFPNGDKFRIITEVDVVTKTFKHVDLTDYLTDGTKSWTTF